MPLTSTSVPQPYLPSTAEEVFAFARRFSVPQVITRVSFSAFAPKGSAIAMHSIAAQAAFLLLFCISEFLLCH